MDLQRFGAIVALFEPFEKRVQIRVGGRHGSRRKGRRGTPIAADASHYV